VLQAVGGVGNSCVLPPYVGSRLVGAEVVEAGGESAALEQPIPVPVQRRKEDAAYSGKLACRDTNT